MIKLLAWIAVYGVAIFGGYVLAVKPLLRPWMEERRRLREAKRRARQLEFVCFVCLNEKGVIDERRDVFDDKTRKFAHANCYRRLLTGRFDT